MQYRNPWTQLNQTPGPIGRLAQGIQTGTGLAQQKQQMELLEKQQMEAEIAKRQGEYDERYLSNIDYGAMGFSPQMEAIMKRDPNLRNEIIKAKMAAQIKNKYGTDKKGWSAMWLRNKKTNELTPSRMTQSDEPELINAPEGYQYVDPMTYLDVGGSLEGRGKYGTKGESILKTLSQSDKIAVARNRISDSINKRDWKQFDLTLQKYEDLLQDKDKKAKARKEGINLAGQTVIEDLGRGIEVLENNREQIITTAAGPIGGFMAIIPFVGDATEAGQLNKLSESIKSNISIDRLQAMRESSPTGGALGAIPVQQQRYLMQLLGSLEITQMPQVLEDNMKRIYNIYNDAVHGFGNGPNGGFRYKLSFDEMGRTISGGREWQGIPGSEDQKEWEFLQQWKAEKKK